jgi:hypothetical protein
MSENVVLSKIFGPKKEVTGEWRRLHDEEFNLLKPSGFLRTTRLNIQKFYMVLVFELIVLCGYQNRQRLLLYT